MRLSDKEFKAMNRPFRRFLQKTIELPTFLKAGLSLTGKHVLEIGCGSGYGAELLLNFHPESYTGIDLMPEQIALAEQRGLNECVFHVQDARDLSQFTAGYFDVVIIWGILHHIHEWRLVIREIQKVLAPGGHFFLEEPDLKFLNRWESVFKWGHPEGNDFSLSACEKFCEFLGFYIEKKKKIFSFGIYNFLKLK